jgi:hypothetical protein
MAESTNLAVFIDFENLASASSTAEASSISHKILERLVETGKVTSRRPTRMG